MYTLTGRLGHLLRSGLRLGFGRFRFNRLLLLDGLSFCGGFRLLSCLLLWCLLSGFSCGGSGGCLCISVDFKELSSDSNGIALRCEILLNDSGVSSEDINGDLISLDFGNRFVGLDEVTGHFDELLDHSLRNRVAHRRDFLDGDGEESGLEVVEAKGASGFGCCHSLAPGAH